ncbi:class I SAM-dependent DNA methyltransferase [Oceanirhabdus sp. W0125-5]|uniref:class I SAM-dependent DNA methyltransferase n=1 Tax=Oceanirhabdus sp. W0125-5 TaxID=2999116 RepID=UPI0022F3275C|nr:class I SAM-dependent methyltransferase [Oceanirhabdus sp. W0125-5]WBW99399.1 class I SAM-dependent methyltransferase [Oceanirhabdus sp. W0125-5]
MICYNRLAEIYDQLIYEDVDYKKIGNFIMNQMEELDINKKKYLDLACGTGNLTASIGENFNTVYGLDLSQDMLCKAEDKLRQSKLNHKLFCMDITDFNINDKVDLVTSCLDSTNYIIEEKKIIDYFNCVYNVLNEKGIFVFDINSEYKLREVLGNNTYTYDEEDVFYVWENEIENQCINMYLTFFIKNGQVYERFDEEHTERIYSVKMIESILKSCGFDIIKIRDNYSENKITETTERIIFVVKKR